MTSAPPSLPRVPRRWLVGHAIRESTTVYVPNIGTLGMGRHTRIAVVSGSVGRGRFGFGIVHVVAAAIARIRASRDCLLVRLCHQSKHCLG